MAFTKADVAPRNINGELVQLSEAEKQEFVDDWNNPVDNRTYDQKRREEYASIADQLDMQYWDSVNGTTTWADHIAAVKAAHPKP
jgi:hypothetical protein